jgi:hypothetical protein
MRKWLDLIWPTLESSPAELAASRLAESREIMTGAISAYGEAEGAKTPHGCGAQSP